jgi:hypothetical protein
MSTTRRVKSAPASDEPVPEGVRVYNMKIFRQLLADAPPDDAGGDEEPDDGGLSAEEARRATRKELFARQQKKQAAELAEALRMSRLKADIKRETEFEGRVRELGDGKPLTDSIDKFLTVTQAAEVTKKEALYTEWESGVFEVLQQSVNRSVDSVNHKELTKRRNEEFQKFLHASNNTSGVFLDTVFEGDAEPAKAVALKTRIKPIRDPVRRSILKHRDEVSPRVVRWGVVVVAPSAHAVVPGGLSCGSGGGGVDVRVVVP